MLTREINKKILHLQEQISSIYVDFTEMLIYPLCVTRIITKAVLKLYHMYCWDIYSCFFFFCIFITIYSSRNVSLAQNLRTIHFVIVKSINLSVISEMIFRAICVHSKIALYLAVVAFHWKHWHFISEMWNECLCNVCVLQHIKLFTMKVSLYFTIIIMV